MNISKRAKGHSVARRTRVFRAGLFASVLLGAGVVTAVASYESPGAEPRPAKTAATPAVPAGNMVTVEVGGRKLQVNAQAMQQGPLTQEEAAQIAEALKGNKSTEGLVEVRHEDGSVSMDLQDRFQNVTLARKNDDGSVTMACVDSPEAAEAFLRGAGRTPSADVPGTNRKAAVKE